jgi:gluconolactonase
VLDKTEGIYFTDSIRKEGAVFYCRKDGSQVVVAENLDYPNGLVLSADEKSLFIAESYANRILKLNLSGPGCLQGRPEVFSLLPQNRQRGYNLPDGMAVDKKGNLFVAHYGMQAIQVISPSGRLLFSVDTGLPLTSNLIICEAGTLIVTGGYEEPGPGAVLRIQLNVENEWLDQAFS